MATSTFRNKNIVRPHKKSAAKRKRVRDQRKRLIGLGMPAEQVEKLCYREVRDLLKFPVKVQKAYQTAE
ncbi:MAG: hypothetical protein HN849_26545 [Victivallales bacterium]|jgi:hypothetical protein|nr:hypothetical protein [Victivallales bacterium]MBT7163106.1 hypothetical protein [Victivallales bacterium]MBT7303119.1 hypothetical protein [Victivallales bacterium]